MGEGEEGAAEMWADVEEATDGAEVALTDDEPVAGLAGVSVVGWGEDICISSGSLSNGNGGDIPVCWRGSSILRI